MSLPRWRRWLGPANRCTVPFASFSEYETTADKKKIPAWFALDESRPLAAFAGIWTTWTSVSTAFSMGWVFESESGAATINKLR